MGVPVETAGAAWGLKTRIAAPMAITKNTPTEIATSSNFFCSIKTPYSPKWERISFIRRSSFSCLLEAEKPKPWFSTL
jgi:hypothetical protein